MPRTLTASRAAAKADKLEPLPQQGGEYLAFLQHERSLAPRSLLAYRLDLQQFQGSLDGRSLLSAGEPDVRAFVMRLHAEGVKPRSIARKLSTLRGFYRWLVTHDGAQMPSNPAQHVKAPKLPRLLPQALSVDQAIGLVEFEQEDENPVRKRRNHALIELFYGCGLRRSEVVLLDWHFVQTPDYTSRAWIDLEGAEVHVLGKGNKTRLVPLGKPAKVALRAWLEVRAQWQDGAGIEPDDAHALFIGEQGRRIANSVISQVVHATALGAGIPQKVHPHMLRHSYASHLLQSSQDLRGVQELLGHSSIASTQIYTRLDFQHLSKSYDQHHPRARRSVKQKKETEG